MVWTAPMTWVDERPLTSAQLNTHIRDNLLETAPAKAFNEGGYFVTAAPHSIVQRLPMKTWIATSETTTSESYTDLATHGPVVRLTCGQSAAVFVSARMGISTAGFTMTSVKVEGQTSIDADDSRALVFGQSSPDGNTGSTFFALTALNPGEHTFTMQYRTTAGTGTFLRRRLVVFPF